ncbi:tRNA 2-thiouridine(34) synthase MnmA [Chloroflexota bacterium]
MSRILAALSGGVDSAVAAALLKEAGHDVTGVMMAIWSGEASAAKEGLRHACYGPGEDQDIKDAEAAAKVIGIPFKNFNLHKVYSENVLAYFSAESLAGRTPNPCVRCNHLVKFEALYHQAQQAGMAADGFGTGHYAQVDYDAKTGRYRLKKGADHGQDQSYFLSFLSQEQLSRTLFPVGGLTKKQVRAKAASLGLPVSDKPDSQEFIAGGYQTLLSGGENPGHIVDTQGRMLGRHRGIAFYTIGQRRGLGIAAKDPLYVTEIHPEANTVVVGGRTEIYKSRFIVSNINWISFSELAQPREMSTRIRYRHEEAASLVTPLDTKRTEVAFTRPQMAITPGQVAAFYVDEQVAGGGIIEKVLE